MSKVNNPERTLQDDPISVKIKLSALWASVTLCYLYGDYFELYVPGKTTGLATGDNLLNSPEKLLLAAVLLAIPAVMVFLSVVLKPKINRALNLITGLFFTGIMLLIAFSSSLPWKMFYIFLALTESAITTLIVWYAWNWPSQTTEN